MDKSDLTPGTKLRMLRGHHPGAIVEVTRAPTANAVELRTLRTPGGGSLHPDLITRGVRDYSVEWLMNNAELEREPERERPAHPEPPPLMQVLYAHGIEDDAVIMRWYDGDLTATQVYMWMSDMVDRRVEAGEFQEALRFLGLPQVKPEKVAPLPAYTPPEHITPAEQEVARRAVEIMRAPAVVPVPQEGTREQIIARVTGLPKGVPGSTVIMLGAINALGWTREAWALARDRCDDVTLERLTDGIIRATTPDRMRSVDDYLRVHSTRKGMRTETALPEGFRLGDGYKPPETYEWRLTRTGYDEVTGHGRLPGTSHHAKGKNAAHKNGPVVQKVPPTPASHRPSASLDPVVQQMTATRDRLAGDVERLGTSVAKLREDLDTQSTMLERANHDLARIDLALEAITKMEGA